MPDITHRLPALHRFPRQRMRVSRCFRSCERRLAMPAPASVHRFGLVLWCSLVRRAHASTARCAGAGDVPVACHARLSGPRMRVACQSGQRRSRTMSGQFAASALPVIARRSQNVFDGIHAITRKTSSLADIRSPSALRLRTRSSSPPTARRSRRVGNGASSPSDERMPASASITPSASLASEASCEA